MASEITQFVAISVLFTVLCMFMIGAFAYMIIKDIDK